MYDALLIQLERKGVPLETHTSVPYTFDFGPKELANMVGLHPKETNIIVRKLLDNRKIQVVNDKIYTTVVGEIIKQTEFYRKMQKIEKARKESSFH